MTSTHHRLRTVIGIVIAASVFIADQVSKSYIFTMLAGYSHSGLEICRFLHLVQVWNTGISFGMFHGQTHGPVILTFVALCITVFLSGWLFKAREWLVITALSLVIGGALGNISDRLRFGAVADFLDFHIGTYHWPAFNLADAAVCIGVALLLYDSIMRTSHVAQEDVQKS